MKSLRFLLPVVGLVGSFAIACTEDDGSSPGGEAGAGGASTPGEAGAGGQAGDAVGGQGGDGAAGASGGACSTEGAGTLVIEVSGLPDDVAADILVEGAIDLAFEGSETLEGVDAGDYTVRAGRVFDTDTIVRTVYDAVVTTPELCVADGASHTIEVTYQAIPSSNKLWLASGLDDELVAFPAADLGETATVEATVAIDAPGAVSVAFDRDGNLWAVGPIIGEDMLVRIPASELGESGTREPDVRIKATDIECFPHINHIAFDPDGNLWLSACENTVHSISAANLTTSGDKESDVLFTEVEDNAGLAFDADGNLWVAGGPVLRRFDAARLGISDTDPPDLTIAVTTATVDNSAIEGGELAFDKAGNLWGVAGSTIFQLAASDLNDTGEQAVKANVSFAIDVLALPSTPAFDDGNGLWIDLAEGEFGRFSPAQLGTSSGPGAPVTPATLISSTSISTSLPLAFFPAPEGLPLYHSLPE